MIQVVRCPVEEVNVWAQQADVLVPFMARIDQPVIEAAQTTRLIIQYGVGVEGVDIPAVSLLTPLRCRTELCGSAPASGRLISSRTSGKEAR